jgi:hypothetical protein
VNGRRAGLIIDGQARTRISLPPEPSVKNWPYSYLPRLPQDPRALLAYVKRIDIADGASGEMADQSVFDALREMVDTPVVPAPLRAAAFRALKMVRGVTVAPDAVDLAGRHGIALARSNGFFRELLILDGKTYRYLGTSYIWFRPANGVPAGGVGLADAVLTVGVVDRVGQRPQRLR